MANITQNKKVVKVWFNDLRDVETKKLDESLLKTIENQLNLAPGEYVVISNEDVIFNYNANQTIQLDEDIKEEN